MTILLMALLIISQMVIFPLISFRWAKEISLIMLILTTLCSLIWKKNKFIALFIGWSVFQFFLFKSYYVMDAKDPPEYHINVWAMLNLINIVLMGLFYYILHNLKLNKEKIYKTLCFIAIFQSVYIILQSLQLDQFFYNTSSSMDEMARLGRKVNWPVGTIANESLVGWLIAICSASFLAFKDLRFKIGYVICFIAVLLTRASTGIVGFVLGFLFWLFFKNRKLAILLLIGILITGGVLIHTGKFNYYLKDTHRFQVWKKTVGIWRTSHAEITGLGAGSFKTIFWEKAPEFRTDGHWGQTHNDYLQLLFEHGIVGLGIILWLIWYTFYNFFKKRRGVIPATGILIFLFCSFLGFPMHTSMGVLLILLLVLLEKDLWEEEAT